MATDVLPQTDSGGGAPSVDKGAEYFGFIIAFLLPGLVGLWAASYPSPSVKRWMDEAATNSTSVGGFLFLMVAAVGAGLALQTLRWVLFEQALPALCTDKFCSDWLLKRPEFDERRIGDASVQAALADLRDEHYRYYQAHGALAIAVPLVFVTWLFFGSPGGWLKIGLAGSLALSFAAVSGFAALDALWRMRLKRRALLGEAK